MWSLAVRVLLSLCLILNGFGTSHAGMHATGRDSASAGQASAAAAGAPCHGSHATGAAAPVGGEHLMSGKSLAGNDDSMPDCCRHAGCAGSCLQHAPAAVACWFSSAIIARTFEPPAVSVAHAPPEDPPLTRPPII